MSITNAYQSYNLLSGEKTEEEDRPRVTDVQKKGTREENKEKERERCKQRQSLNTNIYMKIGSVFINQSHPVGIKIKLLMI